MTARDVPQTHTNSASAKVVRLTTRRRGEAALKPAHRRKGSTGDSTAPAQSEATDNCWGEKLRTHRRRQTSVASILDATFGGLADCNPDLWDRRAYLMLVGLVYDKLATNEEELPTDELVALAKVLAESRRAAVRAEQNRPTGEPAGDEAAHSGKLPEEFTDVVRQVYGTNFHSPDDN